MSLDANYILSYNVNHYIEPTPMQKDRDYLMIKYGGEFTTFNHGYSIYWEKPKYTLSREEFNNLMADQILEKKDCEQWSIVK